MPKKNIYQPPHPGLVLKRDFLDPLGITVSCLATKLGVSRNTLSSIINARSGLSADMALRLSKAFKTTPKMWINLKTNYELWAAEQLDSGWKDIEPLQIRRRHRRSPQRPRKQDK